MARNRNIFPMGFVRYVFLFDFGKSNFETVHETITHIRIFDYSDIYHFVDDVTIIFEPVVFFFFRYAYGSGELMSFLVFCVLN